MRTLSAHSFYLPASAGVRNIVLALLVAGCATKPAPTQVPVTTDSNQPTTPGVQTIKESRFLGILSPYRFDNQQGNFVSSEAMTQMKEAINRPEGMTRDQVRFLLGTPLVSDVFHADRWDYLFRLRKSNGEVITSHVSVTFSGNKVDKVNGTSLPTEKDYITLIAGNVKTK